MSQCPICGKSYSLSYNLKRHIKHVHEKMTPEMGMVVHNTKPTKMFALPKLIQPFTCLVARQTGSGKFFLKKLQIKMKRFINAYKELCGTITNGSLFMSQ